MLAGARLDEQMYAEIDAIAAATGQKRAEVVRELIGEALEVRRAVAR